MSHEKRTTGEGILKGEEDDLGDGSGPSTKARKAMVWIVVILLSLPILFYLFEYVVPRLLPANF
jgi:hypothetical protein